MLRKLCCFLAKCVYLNFRKSVLQDEIFKQLRVDCGKEFYLSLVIQELFRELRNDHTISPYRQTQSKKVSIFVSIQWKLGSCQHFEKIYRTDFETLTWFSNLFGFCPASFGLKTWAKKIDLKNLSEMVILVLMASLNFTFAYWNLPVERIWSELNARVKYPIKKVLVEMDNNMEIDMNIDDHKFCISTVSCLVAEFGLNKVVQTWNPHPIPGIRLFDQEKNVVLLNGNRNLKIKFEFKIRNSI